MEMSFKQETCFALLFFSPVLSYSQRSDLFY